MIPTSRQLPTPLNSHAPCPPGNAVDYVDAPIREEEKVRGRVDVEKHVQERLEQLPDPVRRHRLVRDRELRLLSISDDEPPSKKAKADLARYWSLRDQFMSPWEKDFLKRALRANPSHRNVVRHAGWLARMFYHRVGEEP